MGRIRVFAAQPGKLPPLPPEEFLGKGGGFFRSAVVHAILRAFENSRNGFAHALKSERAIRQEIALLLVSVPMAFVLSRDYWHRAVLVGSLLAVISIELLNTCVEKLCDHVTPALHPEVKAVKDMGSAAVLFAFLAAGGFWLVALLARLGWL